MGNPYTSVSVSGYNANPPSDDGSQTEANRLTWAKHKTKLGDPVKTALESINTNVAAAFAKIIGGAGVTSTAVSYAVVAADQGKLIRATAAGVTISAIDADDVDAPFVFGVLNDSTGDITLDGNGSQTINGDLSVTIGPNEGGLCFSDGSNFYIIGLTKRTQVLPQGRLTPTTATPVINADVSAGTSIYYTPYIGNLVPISDGTLFTVREFSELTLALHSNHTASAIYDVFAFDDSGTIRIGTGPAWNTATAGSGARGTGAGTTQIERLKGLWVNTVSMTVRNGGTTYSVAARAGTYLGSIYIDGSAGQVTCHVAYGQNRKHGVWNAYNRAPVILRAGDSTASWNYTTNTIRQSNAAAGNKLTVFSGLAEETFDLRFRQKVVAGPDTGTTTPNVQFEAGIGVDSTSAFSGLVAKSGLEIAAASNIYIINTTVLNAEHIVLPQLGISNINSLERTTNATGTNVTVNYQGGSDDMQLIAKWMA